MNLIPLQTAYVTQQRDIDENKWQVLDEEGNKIAELPRTLSTKEALSYLHFSKPFELKALNIGIEHGKSEMKKIAEPRIIKLLDDIKFLVEKNELLSTKLEKFIIGKGE